MRPLVSLEFSAKDAPKAVQRGDAVIVIDVLRCCSTIVTALANAAEGVIPTKTVSEARRLHKKHPELILAGERGGIKPKGFHLGNSPLEFSPRAIGGKRIILTTTSGTKAIVLSQKTGWVLIGALLNSEAVAKAALKIAEKERLGISLVLSGRGGKHFSLEDFLCAGLIVGSLPTDRVELSDAALGSWLSFQQSRRSLYETIQDGYHARYLKSIGFEEDIRYCSQVNVFDIVPIYRNGIITPLNLNSL
ncbi:MAG: 2-phosphosulfolactate phosphatase [Candidatus Bathyarchaeia archaeon]